MSLKVITIDFWNTLFDSSNGMERNAYRRNSLFKEIEKYDVIVKDEEFADALKAAWEYFNNIWINDMRTPTPFETAEFFWRQLKLPYNEKSILEISESFGEAILVYPPKLVEGVKESLMKLYGKYKLGIVSDTGFSPGTALRQLMELNEIIEYFDAFSFSDETGVSKPHPKAFQSVLEKFECLPEESLHIGDIEQTDIEGAKSLGMKAIRFNGDTSYPQTPERKEFTIADAESDSWVDIVRLIEEFNN